MVQYIITPWRNQAELLKVRSQFYHQFLDQEEKINSSNNNNYRIINHENEQKQLEDENEKKEAVARVRLWMQRGNCPHLIESTAILTSAILNDLRGGNESYCVRAVYAAAFSRMYVIAKTIGLPATFVELRHQATHEELPSLIRLRTATQKALQWIWSYYWVNLTEISSISSTTTSQLDQKSKNTACQNWLRSLFVTMNNNHNNVQAPVQKILNEARHYSSKHWSDNCLLTALLEIQDSTDDVSILLHVAQLQAMILGVHSYRTFPAPSKTSFSEVHAELESMKHDLCSLEMPIGEDKIDSSSQELSRGWALWDGPWIPKPIGII
ncbi:hypothetical protein EPUL_002925 [Erysiphe pulchra]|uniref:Pre-rRNA-processing protein las1 n=1 Tax=Erysiphe pulchra TaxID=225359 RepID=A0A2S4PWZ8_9PEZI|nr:hypothetical protein EPUL_002925 [Erysiphe pulchra]